jgi:hypothetical protein
MAEAFSENEADDLKITIEDSEPTNINANSLIIANAAPPTTLLAQGGMEPNPFDGKLNGDN